MFRQSVLALLCLLSNQHSAVLGDNSIRKRSLAHDRNKGFANFEPLPEIDGQRDLAAAVVTKDYDAANIRFSNKPRTISELEHGQFYSQQQNLPYNSAATKKNGPKIRTRNLTLQTCSNGLGTQYVVECVAGSEKHCHLELMQAGVEIVNDLPDSDYFAVCIETEEQKSLLMELTDVVDLEEDFVRTLSHIPESFKPVDSRRLQGSQEIGYGVEMIKAPEFWSSKQSKGESVTVCIVDTGLNTAHEDMNGATVDGSTSGSVVRDWDEDDAGHGK